MYSGSLLCRIAQRALAPARPVDEARIRRMPGCKGIQRARGILPSAEPVFLRCMETMKHRISSYSLTVYVFDYRLSGTGRPLRVSTTFRSSPLCFPNLVAASRSSVPKFKYSGYFPYCRRSALNPVPSHLHTTVRCHRRHSRLSSKRRTSHSHF
jgi:hypothetical protein